MSAIYPIGLPIALSLVAYNACLTGMIVWLKRRDRPGFWYFITSFNIFIWGMGISFMLHNELPAQTAQWWGTFSQAAALLIPATWLHFVLAYTERLKKYKILLIFVYVIALAMLPFSFTDKFVAGYKAVVGVNHYPIPGPLYKIFTGLFVLSISFSFWNFFRAIQKAQLATKKKDYQWVCYASLYGFVVGSMSFLPIYGIELPQYNLLIMPMWQVLIAYAMIRHQMFDIDEIMRAARKDKLAAIGTLSTSINHEIRNPLYIIKSLSEAHLYDRQEDIYKSDKEALQKTQEVLQKTAHQATRAMEIMKSFSTFAKKSVNEQGKTESVNLNEVLNDIQPLVGHELELDQIEFKKDIPKNLSPIKADRRHVEEILFNLIVNACHAMKAKSTLSFEGEGSLPASGGGEGSCIAITAAQQNGHVKIKIQDTGPGITKEDQKKIFEPFYTTKKEGTGLGLYITKQLVERNNGKIALTSKPGQGSTFKLEFKR